jgi:uracil-DNA glycosylase family protein
MKAEPRPIIVPANDYEAVRAAASDCRACPLWAPATQTVFGEGPIDADVMLVGEQPGDQEDLKGAPFVGPAGEVLDRALAEAGLDRTQVYVTNAVKHFSFVERGRRRIHQTPRLPEIVQREVGFSTAVAGFAQLLKGGAYTGKLSYEDVIEQAQKARGEDRNGYRAEFVDLVRKAGKAKGM